MPVPFGTVCTTQYIFLPTIHSGGADLKSAPPLNFYRFLMYDGSNSPQYSNIEVEIITEDISSVRASVVSLIVAKSVAVGNTKLSKVLLSKNTKWL